MTAPYVHSALRGQNQKRLWDPLELELNVIKLELWIVVSQHVDARKKPVSSKRLTNVLKTSL